MQDRPFKHVEQNLVRDGAALYTTDRDSERMARIRQAATAPELRVRQICTRLGMRYRTRNRDLPGSPDLANRTRAWAIFVHGCYWHRHEGCRKATTPRTNRAFWLAKFACNRERDREACAELSAAGIIVKVIWECETGHPEQLYRTLRDFALRVGYPIPDVGA